jgi:ribosomal protein S18 acetylase RimI-like enzyme
MIGVATRHQGAGIGTTMVAALTGRCDRDGTWMYLETESESNVRFYERHGFRLLKTLVLPRLDVPMWQMSRPPETPKDTHRA